MLQSQPWKKQNSNQIVKVEKMVVLVKTDHYHHKFQLFQLSYEIVEEFKTIQFWHKKSPGGKT